jgi:triosephosphate isomerase
MKPLIAANWKMHKTQEQARAFIDTLMGEALPDDREVLFAASPTLLPVMGELLFHRDVLLAGQNMHFEDEGAFTGEVSPVQLKDTGATHVILGHSERRHIFRETNEMLNKKLHAAQEHGITPVYCVGETLEQRNDGRAEGIVKEQLEKGLAGLADEFTKTVVVAYEPVWAIGTGETATPQQAQEMHAAIRAHLPDTRILYGGSVKPHNAAELIAQPDINGFLVGGASLKPDSFRAIIDASL